MDLFIKLNEIWEKQFLKNDEVYESNQSNEWRAIWLAIRLATNTTRQLQWFRLVEVLLISRSMIQPLKIEKLTFQSDACRMNGASLEMRTVLDNLTARESGCVR